MRLSHSGQGRSSYGIVPMEGEAAAVRYSVRFCAKLPPPGPEGSTPSTQPPPGPKCPRQRDMPGALQVHTSVLGMRCFGLGTHSESLLMERLITLAIAVLVSAIVVWILKQLFKHIRIWEWEKGLKYSQGRFTRVLEPGNYWIFAYSSSITRIDMRPRTVVSTGQEVLSADNIAVKVSAAIRYRVVDPVGATHNQQDYQQALYLLVQIAIREVVAAYPIDDLLEKRLELDKMLLDRTTKGFEELGLELTGINIRDITFPGDLKKVFALVVKARKEGLAALERARGETAALRNLANGARLLEDNSTLLQLRTIQALGDSAGNRLVLNMTGPGGVIPTKTPSRQRSNQSGDMQRDEE